MTSNSDGGYVVSASGEGAGSFAYQACDDDSGETIWISTIGGGFPAWFQIDMGAGNEIVPTGLQMRAYGADPGVSPDDIEVYASNAVTFGAAQLLYANAAIPTWTGGETKTFTF